MVGSLLPEPKQQFLSDIGVPLFAGKIFTYSAGTLTPKVTYQDQALTIENTNPVIANARGEVVMYGSGSYRIILKDSFDVTIYDRDNVDTADLASTALKNELASSIGASLIGGGAQAFTSIAGLRLASKLSPSKNAIVYGYYSPGDGGGGLYSYDQTDTTSVDDGGRIIVANDGGRWKLSGQDSPVSVKQYGAKGDGITDDTSRILAAVSKGPTSFTDGNYLLSLPIPVVDYTYVEFTNKALLKAAVNNLTFFKTDLHSYYAKLISVNLDGNDKTNVTGLNLLNFRVGASLTEPRMTNMTNGMVMDSCFGTVILSPTCYHGVPNPLTVVQNCADMRVINPAFNNETGTATNPPNTGVGTVIALGAIPNEGVVIDGGYIQGFDTNLVDNALATKLLNVYFENGITADIFSNGARNYLYSGCQHWAAVGACAYKARNCDAGTIFAPTMGSGGRTQFLDYDATNTNCYIYEAGSNASYNTPRGVDIGIGRIPQQGKGTFLPVLSGSGTAGVGTYVTQAGEYTVTGDNVEFRLTVACSAHTGTGAMVITGLPPILSPLSYFPYKKFAAAYQFAFTGPVIYAGFNGTATTITPRQLTALGAEGLVPLPAGLSTTDIWGSYKFR